MTRRQNKFLDWILFTALSFIWGSSFILMKEGMKALSAYQVATLRMLSAGIVLVPVAVMHIRKMDKSKFGLILLSGLLGSFFPAFLFCIAETKIDSSLAGFLNALTPVSTVVIGFAFFKHPVSSAKIPGLAIAFAGMIVLFLAKENVNLSYLSYSSFILLATICYAVNVNMVTRYLNDIGSVNIATFAFVMLMVPSFIILALSGFFNLEINNPVLYSVSASSLLGILGTAIGSILFYLLLKRSGTLFSSMVTYGIPFVALFWGTISGESINIWQVLGLAIILYGVYRTTRYK